MDLTKQIEEESEIEQKNKRPAVSADDIPVSYELITPEWLTHFMCKGYPSAKVMSHRLDVPDEGNTNRRRIFLTYNEAGNAAKLPGSVFCKAAQRLANRLVLASCGLTNGEVTFYNKVRPLLNIEAPKCFLATYHPRSYNCIIVLEDQVSLGGAMGLAHWQGIAGGDWGRDVAYAISTALSINERRAWERDLLQYYLDKLHEAGAPTIGFNEAWNSYRRHLFTSLAWWTLTLTPSSGSSEEAPPDFQPKDACLEFIRRMSTTIDDLEALDSF